MPEWYKMRVEQNPRVESEPFLEMVWHRQGPGSWHLDVNKDLLITLKSQIQVYSTEKSFKKSFQEVGFS